MIAGPMLAAATLVSEDAATLTAGALVAARAMSAPWAIAWVALGIWLGDLALFTIGRLARRSAPVARWVNRRWTPTAVTAVEARLQRGAPTAVFVSRFLPGTRVLLYVAAGLLQVRPLSFAVSTAAAALVWTASIVAAVGSIGAWW